MTEKRSLKIESAVNEPGFVQRYGAEDAQQGLIGRASSEGPILEALDRTRAKGYKVAALIFKMIYPLPEKEARNFIDTIPMVSVVELNASGQFANYLRGRLSASLEQFNIITGLPFKAGDIEDYIEGVLQYG